MERYLSKSVPQDLERKMVFVAGPRQVGKTTLAKSVVGADGGYLCRDVDDDRSAILQREFPVAKTLALDEIHKYALGENLLKGLYDGSRDRALRILVTGSARLDFYRRGGDSLQGRYFFYRIHPLSLAEIGDSTQKGLGDLLTLGGFPEPFLSQNERLARRWSLDYRTRMVREDLQSLERFEDIGNIELLLLRLPHLVGSPLSLNSLREGLQVSHHAVRRWLDALERLYAFSEFRLSVHRVYAP